MGEHDVNSLRKEIESMKDEQQEQNLRLKSIETKIDLLIEGRIKPNPKYQENQSENKRLIIEVIKAVSAGIAGAIAAAAAMWGKINGG